MSLLAAIAADPDAIDNWLVYADSLVESGDPRGELILLELAIEAGNASDELRERHRALMRDEDALCSLRLVEHVHHLNLQWWRGFIRGAAVFGPEDDPPTRDVLDALFADPHACVLRTLDLGDHVELASAPSRNNVRELSLAVRRACDLLLDAAFPMLETLALGYDPDLGYYDAGSDGPEGLDGPERLEHAGLAQLHGHACSALSTGQFVLSNLVELSVTTDPRDLFAPKGILSRPPPKLASLNLHVRSPEPVRALRASPLCAQLQAFTCGVDEAVVDELARDPAPFRRMDLKLYGVVETTAERDALVTRITTLLPNALLDLDAMDTYEPEPEPSPPLLDPDAAKAIEDGMKRLADRMRRR